MLVFLPYKLFFRTQCTFVYGSHSAPLLFDRTCTMLQVRNYSLKIITQPQLLYMVINIDPSRGTGLALTLHTRSNLERDTYWEPWTLIYCEIRSIIIYIQILIICSIFLALKIVEWDMQQSCSFLLLERIRRDTSFSLQTAQERLSKSVSVQPALFVSHCTFFLFFLSAALTRQPSSSFFFVFNGKHGNRKQCKICFDTSGIIQCRILPIW